jgi:putative Holliday junction resolvase
MADQASNILSLDVGTVRIGVAIARLDIKLAGPLTAITNSPEVITDITKLAAEHNANTLVVGLPRGLDGQSTSQTRYVHDFVDKLKTTGLKIVFQDEALTSLKAEDELKSRDGGRRRYNKGDIDALAATYILEDYLSSHEE